MLTYNFSKPMRLSHYFSTNVYNILKSMTFIIYIINYYIYYF